MTRAQQYADNLAAALNASGMSRHELVAALAEHGCDVTLQAVSGWMTGKYAPSTRHQAAIAKTLRIPAHLLFPISMEAA